MIAVGGTSNAVVFYRVNGSMTPVLIKSITFSPSITFSISMVIATVSYGSFSSKILYFSGSPYAGSINITDLTNITVLTSISNSGYAIEKSGIRLSRLILENAFDVFLNNPNFFILLSLRTDFNDVFTYFTNSHYYDK